MTNEVLCPKCGSNQISAHKKGFSGKKAVAGAVLTGGVGLLAGTIGSNKIKITCLACGYAFNPGDKPIEATAPAKKISPKTAKVLYIIMAVLFLLFAVIFAFASIWIGFAIFILIGGLFVLGARRMSRL
ncbi:MAG TPA: hypothetical protein VK787_13005 [Puia sp.]|jgi:hypothetical protein|nr:hypothetical protein [Puia sp.]